MLSGLCPLAPLLMRSLADMSPPLLVASMKRYADEITCGLCRAKFEQTLSTAAAHWAHVTVRTPNHYPSNKHGANLHSKATI